MTATEARAGGEVFAAAVPDAASQRRGRLVRNLLTVGMVWRREMIRFRRSSARIITGLAQPLLFLFVLGVGLGPVIGKGIRGMSYEQYLFPGVLAMSILFTAMFSAISIVWDREFGFLREMLVAPVSRGALVLGKALGGGSIAVGQGAVLLLAAPFVHARIGLVDIVEMVGLLMLLAFSVVSFGIVIASRMQRIESFQVVMSLIVNPMLFLSGAMFPLTGLPTWLGVAARANPVTYGIDPVRRVVLGDRVALTINGHVVPIWFDVLVVLVLGTAMLGLAVRAFSRDG